MNTEAREGRTGREINEDRQRWWPGTAAIRNAEALLFGPAQKKQVQTANGKTERWNTGINIGSVIMMRGAQRRKGCGDTSHERVAAINGQKLRRQR